MHWRNTAFLCRYGHQDVYRILGRDPVKKPLSPLEIQLFQAALLEHLQSEFTPREVNALTTGHPGTTND